MIINNICPVSASTTRVSFFGWNCREPGQLRNSLVGIRRGPHHNIRVKCDGPRRADLAGSNRPVPADLGKVFAQRKDNASVLGYDSSTFASACTNMSPDDASKNVPRMCLSGVVDPRDCSLVPDLLSSPQYGGPRGANFQGQAEAQGANTVSGDRGAALQALA